MRNKLPGEGAPNRWQLQVDGKLVEAVTFELTHPRFGNLHYGPHPRGYDTWRYSEPHGGVVVLPFNLDKGQLFVGLIHQLRENQGGYVWNAPRGFADPGETPADAAARELFEETGTQHPLTSLGGEPANPNSAFFSTVAEGSGIHFYAAEIPTERLFVRDDGNREYVGTRGPRDHEEAIGEFRFVPWMSAAAVGDMFTNAGVARLLAWLASRSHVGSSDLSGIPGFA